METVEKTPEQLAYDQQREQQQKEYQKRKAVILGRQLAIREGIKKGRKLNIKSKNSICPCGTGLKFKYCCGRKGENLEQARILSLSAW